MTPLPLHPAVVHLPLGLAFVMPVLAFGFTWALWTGRVHARGWITVVLFQALLLGGALAATNTGEREEDRVEAVVPHASLEQHEEYAEQFVRAVAVTLFMAALVLVFTRQTVSRGLALATIVGTLIVAASALRVGHAGGQLVYVHNAGAAYAGGAERAPARNLESRSVR
jgi:hypothetical protein